MDNKKEVREQFGKNAESYVSSPIHKDGRDLQKLLKISNISGGELLLDIATGGGHTANAFAPFVKTVTAMDLTEKMLMAANTFVTENGHQNVHFVLGDAEKLPFSSDSFDIVTCRIAAHHFTNVPGFIKEVFRVLKKDGQFLLDDNVAPEDDELEQFYNQIEKMRDISHFHAWKKTEWLKMLELSGFKIMEWHRFEKTFKFGPWCKRMQLEQLELEKLEDYMLSSSAKIKEKFKIVTHGERVISFQGEAIILKAIKE